MEEGSLRADVNVSVRKHGEPFRTRCEVKNVNSDPLRHAGDRGRGAAADRGLGGRRHGRSRRPGCSTRRAARPAACARKEDAHDYRYFPDPDLLPLVLDEAWVEELRGGAAGTAGREARAVHARYGLSPTTPACWWPNRRPPYFETVAHGRDAKQAANWVIGDLFAGLNRTGRTIEDPPVSAAALGELLDLMADGTINGRIAKDVFEAMVETGEAPAAIVQRRGLRQVTDAGAIDAAVAAVLAANPDKVAEFRGGKDKLFGFFVGQVMKAMEGKGNPALVNEALKRAL